MPTEDFTTYTEVDPNSHITKTADRITWADLIRNEDAYVYKDKGVNHFDGDFEFRFKCEFTSSDNVGVSRMVMLANIINDAYYIESNGDCLSYSFVKGGDAVYRFFIVEADGGTVYSDLSIISAATTYYITFWRDEAVGAYGTINAYICTGNYYGESGYSLVDTLALYLHSSKKDYRYIYGLSSYNDNNTPVQAGWIELLDLQEAPVFQPWAIIM